MSTTLGECHDPNRKVDHIALDRKGFKFFHNKKCHVFLLLMYLQICILINAKQAHSFLP